VFDSDQAGAVAERFFAELESGARDIASLRAAPVDEILRAQRATSLQMGLGGGRLTWQPSLDGDLLCEAPLDAIGAGHAKSIPLLLGTNRDEWKLFMLGDPKGRRLDEAGLRRRLARALPGRDAHGEPLSERAFDAYRAWRGPAGDATPAQRWIAFQSDRIFHLPATRLAERHAAHADATFAYRFDWSPPLLGAFHGIEVPFVFGTIRDPVLRASLGLTRAARQLSARMQDAWIAFARSGDPACEGLPPWPRYDRERRATLLLDGRCSVRESPFESVLGFWEKLL
jgi:carboxylesterase type B